MRIAELAAHTRLPFRVVGMHFFNPVQVLPLVEVIAAKETTVADAGRRFPVTRSVMSAGTVSSSTSATPA